MCFGLKVKNVKLNELATMHMGQPFSHCKHNANERNLGELEGRIYQSTYQDRKAEMEAILPYLAKNEFFRILRTVTTLSMSFFVRDSLYIRLDPT